MTTCDFHLGFHGNHSLFPPSGQRTASLICMQTLFWQWYCRSRPTQTAWKVRVWENVIASSCNSERSPVSVKEEGKKKKDAKFPDRLVGTPRHVVRCVTEGGCSCGAAVLVEMQTAKALAEVTLSDHPSCRLLRLLREMFGPQNVNWSREESERIEVCVDSSVALLDPDSLVRLTHLALKLLLGGLL